MNAYLASLEELFPAIIKTTTKPANTPTNTTTSHQSSSPRKHTYAEVAKPTSSLAVAAQTAPRKLNSITNLVSLQTASRKNSSRTSQNTTQTASSLIIYAVANPDQILIDKADPVEANTTRMDTLEAAVRSLEDELRTMRHLITNIHSLIIQSQPAPTSSPSVSSPDHDMTSQPTTPSTTTKNKSHKSRHSQQSPLPSKQTPEMTAHLASLEELFPAIIKTTTKPANTSTNTTTSHQSTSSPTSEKSTGPPLNTRKEQRGGNQ
jgi:hypothetical protein